MAATVTIVDFREIKAMLKAGWEEDLIVERSGRSHKTVRRIRSSRTFQAYRSRVYNETLSIRRRRAEHRLGGQLLDSAEAHPAVVLRNKVKGIRRFLPW